MSSQKQIIACLVGVFLLASCGQKKPYVQKTEDTDISDAPIGKQVGCYSGELPEQCSDRIAAEDAWKKFNETGDTKYCELMKGKEKEDCLQSDVVQKAQKTGDATGCDSLKKSASSSMEYDACLVNAAIASKNIQLCESISRSAMKDTCRMSLEGVAGTTNTASGIETLASGSTTSPDATAPQPPRRRRR